MQEKQNKNGKVFTIKGPAGVDCCSPSCSLLEIMRERVRGESVVLCYTLKAQKYSI